MSSLNILIVDDELSIRNFFSKLLNLLGHKVFLAENGYLALECVKREKNPDLIFLDFKMSGIDGFETFKKICKINSTVPVVMVTGYISPELEIQVKSAGLNGLVTKPISIKEIKELLQNTQQNLLLKKKKQK